MLTPCEVDARNYNFLYWIFRVMIVMTKLTPDKFPTDRKLMEPPTVSLSPVTIKQFCPSRSLPANGFISACLATHQIHVVCH
jgi:hypothetical protein